MKFEIISQVKIEVTQRDLEEMINLKVARHDANIEVDDIKFVQRRDPTRIEVAVTAHYNTGSSTEPEPEVNGALEHLIVEDMVKRETIKIDEELKEKDEEALLDAMSAASPDGIITDDSFEEDPEPETDSEPTTIASMFGD